MPIRLSAVFVVMECREQTFTREQSRRFVLHLQFPNGIGFQLITRTSIALAPTIYWVDIYVISISEIITAVDVSGCWSY